MNKIVEQVYNNYFEHQDQLQDNYYSSIYYLVNKFESEWNGSGANLKYTLDIKDDYLYLENTRICPMSDLLCCSVHSDSIIYKLKDNKNLYIVIHWVDGADAYISQIYIEDNEDDENCIILYDK